ncbi:MAG: response regulator [Pseudomonadota bacterium]
MLIRALLVEDNPDISDTLIESMEAMTALRFAGVAKTEAAARRWLSANDGNWNLVIVDLFLGEGSGFGVLKDCQKRSASQKVVVLTSYVPDNIVQHCRQLGADAVFDKSQDVEDLVMFCRQYAANLDSVNGVDPILENTERWHQANEALSRQYGRTIPGPVPVPV